MKNYIYAVSCFLILGSPVLAVEASRTAAPEVSEANSPERLDQMASVLLLSPEYADFVETFTKQKDGKERRVSNVKTMTLNERHYVSMSLQSKKLDTNDAWQDDDAEIFADMVYDSRGQAQVFGIYSKLSNVAPIFVSAEGTGVAVPASVGAMLLNTMFTELLPDLSERAKDKGLDLVVSNFSSADEEGMSIGNVWLLSRSAGDLNAPELSWGDVQGKTLLDESGAKVFESVAFLSNGLGTSRP